MLLVLKPSHSPAAAIPSSKLDLFQPHRFLWPTDISCVPHWKFHGYPYGSAQTDRHSPLTLSPLCLCTHRDTSEKLCFSH